MFSVFLVLLSKAKAFDSISISIISLYKIIK